METLQFWRNVDIAFCREHALELSLGAEVGGAMMGRGVVYVVHGHHGGGGMTFEFGEYKFTSYFYPLEKLKQFVQEFPPGLEKMVAEYVVGNEFIVFVNHEPRLPVELKGKGIQWSSVYRFRKK